MIAVAVVALSLVAIMRLVVPIVWDLQGRAGDDHWLKKNWTSKAQGGLSHEQW
jgi:hypothetical protein